MRKIEIAHRMHQNAGIPEDKAAELLDWILELLKATLRKGEPIGISKFGTFILRNKAARRGRNPRTGEDVIIAPRRVVIFRASAHLKAAVSAVEAERQDSEGLLPKGSDSQAAPSKASKELGVSSSVFP
jgi:integration host factor subunit alpha